MKRRLVFSFVASGAILGLGFDSPRLVGTRMEGLSGLWIDQVSDEERRAHGLKDRAKTRHDRITEQRGLQKEKKHMWSDLFAKWGRTTP